MKLWIDVEDLFEYASHDRRPSGIQRFAFEVYSTLNARHRGTELINFVRHGQNGGGFYVVDWSEINALFSRIANTDLVPPAKPQTPPRPIPPPDPAVARVARAVVDRLPASLQHHVKEVALTQARALLALFRFADAMVRGLVRTPLRLGLRLGLLHPPPPPPAPPPPPPPEDRFGPLTAPGDVLVVLGAPWSNPQFAELIAREKARLGLDFALLIYDLIPLRRPEWCDANLVAHFQAWCEAVLPLCDHIFTISRASADDVTAYSAERSIALPRPVTPIPVGSGFAFYDRGVTARIPRQVPPGPYALIVSTIEARKNHLLLFRIWRRMLDEMPRARVPNLVFAGRVGYLVQDLMAQIENTRYLDGKLIHINSPTDAVLAELYRGCQFTLFPSFFEGWGLPVTESLAFGKPCLIADRTSLPEAGGGLVRSFDPDNMAEAYQVIRGTIEDPVGLAAWEARVRRQFRPVPWADTAAAIVEGLGYAPAASLIRRPDRALNA